VRGLNEDGATLLVNNDTYNFVMSVAENRIVCFHRTYKCLLSSRKYDNSIQSMILVVLNLRIYSTHKL
jgi:hypothetical protein